MQTMLRSWHQNKITASERHCGRRKRQARQTATTFSFWSTHPKRQPANQAAGCSRSHNSSGLSLRRAGRRKSRPARHHRQRKDGTPPAAACPPTKHGTQSLLRSTRETLAGWAPCTRQQTTPGAERRARYGTVLSQRGLSRKIRHATLPMFARPRQQL
jgi:hypothetical protein